MDRHQIWRRVRYDYEQAQARRANGYDAVVHAYVAGRAEPVEVGHVETRRGADEQWIRIERAALPALGGAIPPGCSWIHVHETALLSVEVSYRRSDKPGFGFSHSIAGDDSPQELAA
jgi:hypothetical protein